MKNSSCHTYTTTSQNHPLYEGEDSNSYGPALWESCSWANEVAWHPKGLNFLNQWPQEMIDLLKTQFSRAQNDPKKVHVLKPVAMSRWQVQADQHHGHS